MPTAKGALGFVSEEHKSKSYKLKSGTNQQNCSGLVNLDDYKAKCSLLKSNNPSSEYFCCSLESLSCLLKLSPTLAGVTLLSLGNGAPAVFSSLVSFMDSETQDVALNTVLGGALFVTCVVVGTISISVQQKRVRINKPAFVRDVCYLLLVLSSLTLILVYGKINLWGSLAFSLMYIIYVILVYIVYTVWNSDATDDDIDSDSGGLKKPILNGIEKVETACLEQGNMEDGKGSVETKRFCSMLFWIIEMPLYLPRRLTIPIACKDRWSKPMAVVSVSLAPILLSILWDLQDDKTSVIDYVIGCLFGLTFGVIA
ncbi:Sodium/calcium exchanger family protein isoform 2 [Hibiscus syriacus]|uniref:Sodium/calcium exchanger family protein isoform 2 n=1 Tax=Hibiscus syriacus TaxID=106335 RepID=A0A6A3BZ20_HIBSY|nr:Sodium/calcium exchanger family protein isoform 2 [Hibiscus syriacus]